MSQVSQWQFARRVRRGKRTSAAAWCLYFLSSLLNGPGSTSRGGRRQNKPFRVSSRSRKEKNYNEVQRGRAMLGGHSETEEPYVQLRDTAKIRDNKQF